MAQNTVSEETLKRIIARAQALAMNMIYVANHREGVLKGDPKVGGHPSASSSALHLLSVLHLLVKNPQDFIACKPHASPTDHANNYLLRLFREAGDDGKATGPRMSDERARIAMRNLRHLPDNGEPFFQSYHSDFDPDAWHYFPSGSVGIPPVNALYVAYAYKLAAAHGFTVPEDAQFWCIMGDSEYREGSLMEVLPEASERGLGRLTWIVDYNRQCLDGNRILNEDAMGGKDNDRIERTAVANGWDVLQLRHGRFRQEVFARGPEGEALQNVIESGISDYEFQAILGKGDPKTTLEALGRYDTGARKALSSLNEEQLARFMRDLGGHDIEVLKDAYLKSKQDPEKPMLLVAHTVKGWGLSVAAKTGNHSAMLAEEEVKALLKKSGASDDLFAFERFADNSEEGKYLKARGDAVWEGRRAHLELKQKNLSRLQEKVQEFGGNFPSSFDINLKLVPMAHTQWMLGQMSAKLGRIADTPANEVKENERGFKALADLYFTMAPDVGTSTNLNATMDGHVVGSETEHYEKEYAARDTKFPDVVPNASPLARHVRFDIAEGNCMSSVGSFGKLGDYVGVPILPLMTVYDFFIKRALDQLFYNLYWNASFILVGTPSGVTLSPEGAQHAWKSDIQIPNLITWEPAFAQELDWVMAESARRHLATYLEGKDSPNGNAGRSGVLIRLVTRGLEQKELLQRLRLHLRFNGKSEAEIMEQTRKDCLEGAYYLVDYRGMDGYRPSENVLNIFAMGALVTEALAASDELLKEGIYANVIQVSSPDLLVGTLGEKTGYKHLRQGLGITGDLYLSPRRASAEANNANGNGKESYPPALYAPRPTQYTGAAGLSQLLSLGGRRIPVVSVHDGETGLLDNIGSVLGTLQKALAVKKHSKSGTPASIYAYHHIDGKSVAHAAREALAESALSGVQVDAGVAQALGLQAQL